MRSPFGGEAGPVAEEAAGMRQDLQYRMTEVLENHRSRV
jgi:hypothetical protein